jgi:hypothetical protein
VSFVVCCVFTIGTEVSDTADEKLYQYINVRQAKDQGVDGYFLSKIEMYIWVYGLTQLGTF